MTKIITITGVSSTGKTVLAKELAKGLENSVVIDGHYFKRAIAGYDEKHDTEIVDERIFNKLVQDLATSKKYSHIIVESVFAGTVDGNLCVVLRCSIDELKKRLKEKNYSEEKINDNIESELANVCGQEAFDNKYIPNKTLFEFDSSESTTKEISKKVLEIL